MANKEPAHERIGGDEYDSPEDIKANEGKHDSWHLNNLYNWQCTCILLYPLRALFYQPLDDSLTTI